MQLKKKAQVEVANEVMIGFVHFCAKTNISLEYP